MEEWLRLPGDAFNNNARGSWRVDLDFEASGGIEGGGGGGGDERGRGDNGGGGGGNGDESEDDDSSDEDEDESRIMVATTEATSDGLEDTPKPPIKIECNCT